ncbi:MAG TPA: hypothetical protein VMZ33_04070 [Candidatus Limnocylindrales bacterium]|nr:hypothetical protein [Candidatus Limnocylindrales bacterium]
MPIHTRTRRTRLALGLAIALISASVVVPTVLAAPTQNGHGSAAVCRYQETDPADINGNTGFRLTRIAIDPPKLFGTYPGQMVGWRFVVQRHYDDNDPYWNGPWVRIFASRTQKAVANPDASAAFSKMFAKINYVDSVDRWPNGYHTVFRAIATFYWYNADGSVETSERFNMGVYPVYREGVYQFTSYGSCEGSWLDS